jgi:kynurenine formamidase
MDAPLHFIKDGLSVTGLKAGSLFFTKVRVARIENAAAGYQIDSKNFTGIKDCELLLIKTDFEKYRMQNKYHQNSPFLHPHLAAWLKSKCPSLRAIGVDFISISNFKNRDLGRMAHKNFLNNKILIIEDMKLSALKGSPDMVIVAPLLVNEADGSPCTIFGVYG